MGTRCKFTDFFFSILLLNFAKLDIKLAFKFVYLINLLFNFFNLKFLLQVCLYKSLKNEKKRNSYCYFLLIYLVYIIFNITYKTTYVNCKYMNSIPAAYNLSCIESTLMELAFKNTNINFFWSKIFNYFYQILLMFHGDKMDQAVFYY